MINSILVIFSLLNGNHKKLTEDERKKNLNALFQGPFMSILFLTFISMLNKANYSPFVFAYEDLRIVCELVGIDIDKFTLKN